MVEVNREEAYQLLVSLARQLAEDNPNTGRAEMYGMAEGKWLPAGRTYFSIAIDFDKSAGAIMHEIRMKHSDIYKTLCKGLGENEVDGAFKLQRIMDGEE